ncbi:helix-turn-helix domain-containing protein [Hespellia stercorisuis]|uniref:Homeodomain-like domain-containing protein n=1 Tax=Hespellia stercorisuis DSM 15480 TaxID=1121950 RepID=A0A1M6RQ59_9FIRM|nr:helix-turn-helix domain-containing protein [Hespellia stercorisuis]SHK34575.1 Homeodomain-like domain-containing protein [Hespellia stercorisuis DSM 15480]
MIVKKVVCDGCGKEITGDPYRVKIVQQDPDTDDIADKYAYENNAEDFCADCKVRIVDFLYKLTAWRLQEEEESGAELPSPAEPAVNEAPAVQKKTRPVLEEKEQALELHKQGKSMSEISKTTGVKYSTVYSWINPNKCKKKRTGKPAVINKDFENVVDQMIIDEAVGKNADRHKCKICKYRSKVGGKQICDYCSIVGHIRGCEVEDCSVFEKGSPVSKRKTKEFYES